MWVPTICTLPNFYALGKRTIISLLEQLFSKLFLSFLLCHLFWVIIIIVILDGCHVAPFLSVWYEKYFSGRFLSSCYWPFRQPNVFLSCICIFIHLALITELLIIGNEIILNRRGAPLVKLYIMTGKKT